MLLTVFSVHHRNWHFLNNNFRYFLILILNRINFLAVSPFKYEAQTALFKDPVRTAQ